MIGHWPTDGYQHEDSKVTYNDREPLYEQLEVLEHPMSSAAAGLLDKQRWVRISYAMRCLLIAGLDQRRQPLLRPAPGRGANMCMILLLCRDAA